MIKVYDISLPPKSIEYANDAIQSGWISSIGKYTELASNLLSSLCGVNHALLTNNGTSATHLLITLVKEFYPEYTNIILPSSCYVAAYNSVLYEKYHTISCVDISTKTWNMSIDKVPDSSIVLAVHNLGNIINIPKLQEDHNCLVIEDNCEGLFGSYDNYPSGSKSLASSLSFFGNKNISTGEGGALLTNNSDFYEFALKVRGQGQTEKRYIHDILGNNYRMTNIQAAILLGQLESFEETKSLKKNIFDQYKSNLKNCELISLQKSESNTDHSNWMFGVRFKLLDNYKKAESFFEEAGIETRPMFYPYHAHGYINASGPHSNSDLINKQVVVFPSYPSLSTDQIDFICDKIYSFSSQLFWEWGDKEDVL